MLVPLVVFVGACWYDRGLVLAQERTQIGSTLDALAEHVRTVMQNAALAVDLELNETKDQGWPAIRQSTDLARFLRRLQGQLPEVSGTFLIDRNGIVAASSDSGEQPQTDVRDRNFFRRARADPGATVISALAAPRSGPEADATFVVSRARITDGQFDGVAAVSVSAAYFRNFYAPILDSNGTATLLRADGTELFRYPYLLAPGDRPGPDSAAMRRAAVGPGVRMFTARSADDGREKIGAAEVIPGWGLIIAYGVDKQQVLGDWYDDISFFVIIAAASALVLLFTMRRALLSEGRRRHAETALLQAGKLEALGRLTGGVAHDFNNLLSAILGSIELVRRRTTDPLDRQQLALAERAAQRGTKLIGQMLAFARKSPVTPVALDVNALVRDADELVRRTGGPRASVRYQLDSGLWWALADPVQLELSLLNLVANARDAMPQGGEVTIRTRNMPGQEARSSGLAERDHVILEVRDTGRGMSEKERNSAFEPFFTTKQPGKGTGLGLSMVYGFARQLGGTVTIDSRPGDTAVSLCLPRIESPADEESGPLDLAPAGPGSDMDR